MISETGLWIVRHKASNRYYHSDVRAIGRGSVGYDFYFWLTEDPFSATAISSPIPWERMFADTRMEQNYHGWHLVADQFEIVNRPGCKCCGETERALHCAVSPPQDHPSLRCPKHKDRNPCAIEGCSRTTSADGLGRVTDGWLCSVHWRAYCPPRSARRRAYHSFFRKAKKLEDWTPELRADFWSFWDQLVRSARARHAAGAEGHIDVDQINKMFGLDG